MNDQTPIIENPQIEPEVNKLSVIKEKLSSTVKVLVEKFKATKFSESRFYKNKLIFWPVTIMLGLVLLILILGLLFGKKNTNVNSIKNIPTPTPQVQEIPKVIDSDPLSQIEKNLNKLKTQITNFDVKQSRLTPPTVNFDIQF